MIAMQYSFSFAQGYDMTVIARRVAEKSHVFDAWPHLLFKAFLVASENDLDRPANRNLYAPFYLWSNAEAMADFLASTTFSGVCEAFGRPAVESWLPVVEQRKEGFTDATFATREIIAIDPRQPLPELWQRERVLAEQWWEHPAVDAVLVGFQPSNWILVRLVFHRNAHLITPAASVQQYRLLHVSQPVGAA